MTHSYVDRRGYSRNRTYSIAPISFPCRSLVQAIEPKVMVIQPKQSKAAIEFKAQMREWDEVRQQLKEESNVQVS